MINAILIMQYVKRRGFLLLLLMSICTYISIQARSITTTIHILSATHIAPLHPLSITALKTFRNGAFSESC